ncbi:SDR family oxidoreductase [Edaphobacillus lindanitolerans]|uniref:3-oxoacyl-[acyl-carrier protein] reductase n=1 Tax=Edaphobacillus lindanitolerans TaxID=550447 RepID=A0A1U7PMR1_9BACI|nr:SDR family oxidoreductase [Edaphobacillus lindanitolerans]SIT70907.1 3-oxoacyl-[acyl-carrier protein] reductase [Edaphobacillus lindanitolerans]
MDLKLNGKRVLVMASSKGLGKAIATEFAREGAAVFLTSRSEESLSKGAADIKAETGNDAIHYAPCDMSSGDDIIRLFSEVRRTMGDPDILINNTGGPRAGGFDDVTDEDWVHAFGQNLLSYTRTIREALPSMRKNNWGRIVNISSSSTKEVIDNLILSNTMRAGMVGLSKTLARETAGSNILVNTVGPGRIETDRIIELDSVTAKKRGMPIGDITEEQQSRIPMGRYGQPAEFACAVVFLASGANTYLTGQSLVIDGGMLKAL